MNRPPIVVIKKSDPSTPRPQKEKSALERSTFVPKQRPNPLATAKVYLGSRLAERPSGYFLDGCPASLDTIMRATNAVIMATGGEQIVSNPVWEVRAC